MYLIRESPEYVRVSCAAAITLGFQPGLFYRNAKLTCINILMQYREGCRANCLYCGQAREIPSGSECKNLIRVEWPSYRLAEVIERTREVQNNVQRICISTITHPRAPEDLLAIVKGIRKSLDLPVSTLITPTIITKKHMVELKQVGVEMIGIAIDAATPRLFYDLRGKGAGGPHMWSRYFNGLKEAVKIMGKGRVGCHLIVGLGESEEEITSTIQMVHELGAMTHLFSFFPELESALENRPQPPLGQYRRIQMARYLIDSAISKFEKMKFDHMKRITNFGIDVSELMEIIESGEPFKTSGCPGCNRPFANERPSQPIRNFPFPPEKIDIDDIKRQIMDLQTP